MLLLSHAAVSTSGSARQMAKIGGAEYSHVLDPRTGLGMTEGRQVSVQAPSAALADALATAGNVMREEDFRSLGGTVAGSVRPGFFPEFLTFCGKERRNRMAHGGRDRQHDERNGGADAFFKVHLHRPFMKLYRFFLPAVLGAAVFLIIWHGVPESLSGSPSPACA